MLVIFIYSIIYTFLLIINNIQCNDSPTLWGGWNCADNKVETSYLFRTFYAYFDERKRDKQLNTEQLSKLGSLIDDNKHLYVRILFTGLPEHLPSFFDNWKDKFMEHMRNAECIYYCHDKNHLHTVKTPQIYSVPVTFVNGSSFDWSWYPSSYAIPYFLYCPLPSDIGTYVPFAVSVSPPRENNKKQLGIDLNYNSFTHIIFGRNLLKDILNTNDNKTDILKGSSYDIDINHNMSTIDTFAICVSPESGSDYTTGLYNDNNLLISFINYYHTMGINNIFFYDNKIDTNENSQFDIILKKARINGMNVQTIPDEFVHKWQYDHYSGIKLGHDSYMHQSLFTDVCIRRNINLYKYVLLLQYTDFIVPQRVRKLSSLLEDVISRNPNTNSFQFKTVTFLRNVNSKECEQKYNNSYASILCNSEKDSVIFEGDNRAMSRPEKVIDSDQIHVKISDDTTITILDPADVIVHQYKTTNYRHDSSSLSPSLTFSFPNKLYNNDDYNIIGSSIINSEMFNNNEDSSFKMKSIEDHDIPRLMIFTTIKGTISNDFNFKKIQIAINSWLTLSIAPLKVIVRVLLLTDIRVNEKEVKSEIIFEYLKESCWNNLIIKTATNCMHPLFDLPTVDCLFRSAIAASQPREYIMYTNSDIAFFDDLLYTFIAASIKFENKFIMIGRRSIIENEQEADEVYHSDEKSLLSKLQQLFQSNSHQDSDFAQDFFILPQYAFYKLFPPFLVGRASWDNIMTFWLYNQTKSSNSVPLIEISESVLAGHIGMPNNDFDSRKGSEWSIKLLTVWKRMEVGKTTITQFISNKKCNDNNNNNTNCEYNFHERVPQPEVSPEVWQYKEFNRKLHT